MIFGSKLAPQGDPAAGLQLLVTNLDYSDYLGRLAVGRIVNGTLTANSTVAISREEGIDKAKVGVVYSHEGLKRVDVETAIAGDIVALAGLEEVTIGDSLLDLENPNPLARIAVDEPTMSMVFSANTSPFGGREGQYVTARQIRARLEKEALHNVAIRLEILEPRDHPFHRRDGLDGDTGRVKTHGERYPIGLRGGALSNELQRRRGPGGNRENRWFETHQNRR